MLLRTTKYYKVRFRTTQYYYRLLLHTTKHYSVPQSTTQYYSVLHSATPYYKVLHSTTPYYKVLQHSTTPYYKVLPNTTSYYTVLQSTAQYYSVPGSAGSAGSRALPAHAGSRGPPPQGPYRRGPAGPDHWRTQPHYKWSYGPLLITGQKMVRMSPKKEPFQILKVIFPLFFEIMLVFGGVHVFFTLNHVEKRKLKKKTSLLDHLFFWLSKFSWEPSMELFLLSSILLSKPFCFYLWTTVPSK